MGLSIKAILSALSPNNLATNPPQGLREGISYVVIATVGATILGFGTNVIVTRSLGVEQFGLFAVFLSSMTIAVNILTQPAVAGEKYIAEYEGVNDKKGAFSVLRSTLEVQTGLVIVFILLALFFQETVTTHLLDKQSGLYWLFLLAVIVQIYYILFSGVVKGLRQLRFFAMRQILRAALQFGLMIIVVGAAGLGIIGAVSVNLATSFVLTIMMAALVLGVVQQGRLQPNKYRMTWKILHFASLATLINISVVIVNNSGPIIIKMLGQNQVNVEVGLFALILIWGRLVDVILSILVRSSFPYISRWYAQGQIAYLRNYLFQLSLATIGGYLALLIGGWVLAQPIINIVYGAEYLPVVDYIGWAIFMFCAFSLSFIYRGALSGIGKMNALSTITGLSLLVYGAGLYIFHFLLAFDIIQTLLLSMLSSNLTQAVVSFWLLTKTLNFDSSQ